MSLPLWQDRLKQHFDGLRKSRDEVGRRLPIFALEHGLSPQEVAELQAAVRAHVAVQRPRRAHALAWVVYASEFGYGYAGEYWQTFEAQTPGWRENGEREWVRQVFEAFAKQYGGARPGGAWADHFSIICWPTTHAVLPEDLQSEFASILYRLRGSFCAEWFESTALFGERIAEESWRAPSRFQQLAAQSALLGQIATALLLGGPTSEALLLPSTLGRIVANLGVKQLHRTWLEESRAAASRRVHFRGLSRATQHASSPEPTRPQAVGSLGVEPQLLLRPTGDGAWGAFIEFPDLRPLAARFANLRPALTGCRCVVAGTSGRPFARAWLLHGAQRARLVTWPPAAEVLLQFEGAPPELSALLRAECSLRPGATWLFKVTADGDAHEVRSRIVRPGNRYVVVHTDGPPTIGPATTRARLECVGAEAALLEVPGTVSPDVEEHIADLRLNLARGVRAWPVGLPAGAWDGEGHAEWLSTDATCLAIRADHAIADLSLCLDGQALEGVSTTLDASAPIAFVQLPPLPAGHHSVVVTISSTPDRAVESATLEIVTREPRPWTGEASGAGPVEFCAAPLAPTLDQLWDGSAAITGRGPTSRTAACLIRLYPRRSTAPLIERELPALRLPFDEATWSRHFMQHFRERSDVADVYDQSHWCEICLDVGELGRYRLTCEREFSPVRWVVGRSGRRLALWLEDDRGVERTLAVERYSFTEPDHQVSLDPSAFRRGLPAPAEGGLYLARDVDVVRGLILLPGEIKGLAGLQAKPRLRARERRCRHDVEELTDLFTAWAGARATGDVFAIARRRAVLLAIVREIFAVVGGGGWVGAERAVASSAGGAEEPLRPLKVAVGSRREHISLGAAILANSGADEALHQRVSRLASLAQRYLGLPRAFAPPAIGGVLITHERRAGSGDLDWLCEFALRLASAPGGARAWSGAHFGAAVDRLFDNQPLARAARLMVLAVDRALDVPRSSPWHPYAGWAWQ